MDNTNDVTNNNRGLWGMSFFDPYHRHEEENKNDDDINSIDNEEQSCAESVEELPFAVMEDPRDGVVVSSSLLDSTQPLHHPQQAEQQEDMTMVMELNQHSSSLYNSNGTRTRSMKTTGISLGKPPIKSVQTTSQSQETEKTVTMGSSILYSPMSTNYYSSNHSQSMESSQITPRTAALSLPAVTSHSSTDSSTMMGDIEFDAAASLLADHPMLGHSSHFMARSQHRERPTLSSHDLTSKDDNNSNNNNNNTCHNNSTTTTRQLTQLPQQQSLLLTLPELQPLETSSTLSMLTPKATNRSLLGLFDSNSASNTTGPNVVNGLFHRRGIESIKTDLDMYETSMYMYSMSHSVQDVMDVIGNPDLLRLWCEPVRTLVVTRSSEGARSAIQRHTDSGGGGGGDREYDGEWIEATTSALTDPTTTNQTSSVYQMGQYLWSNLGFPSYGKLTMFVERRRGKVGFTMGPFAGNWTTFHTVTVEEEDGCIKIVDRVRIAKDPSADIHHDHDKVICCACCCCGGGGIVNMVQRCIMPSPLDGHIKQSEASLTRLRVLLENGEIALSPPDLIVDGEESDDKRVPLLS